MGFGGLSGGDGLVMVVGGSDDEGVGSETVVVDVGRGAPMVALAWMRLLASMVSGEWMERMYARGCTNVLAPMVIEWGPLT